MRSLMCASIALVIAALPQAASASETRLKFGGANGISGNVLLTYTANPNTGTLGSSPNSVDPVGSYVITGISGVFSDATLGISNAAITGLTGLNRISPDSTNLLAPNSFSLLPVTDGVQSPDGLLPGLHYDNLFYKSGSPQTASDYPFSGGLFDIYGMVFTIAGGDHVNFWSNGVVPDAGLNYGAAVTDGKDVLDYTGGLSAAPELATWAMMVLGFGMMGAGLRCRRRNVGLRYA